MRKTRILIVDDSAVVRRLLAKALQSEPDMEVVGLASDPFVARDLILLHDPDVLTLDIEMPRMDGLTFLRQLMVDWPLPVIIVSSVTQSGSAATIEALAVGAIDVIAKSAGPYSVAPIADQLKQRIRAMRGERSVQLAHRRRCRSWPPGELAQASGWCSSALPPAARRPSNALTRLPADGPPIRRQHMPPHFTLAFARRLDSICPMRVAEAADASRSARHGLHRTR